jgi:hypothetical protein
MRAKTMSDDAAEQRARRANAAQRALKWALESESANRINAMLDLARSEPGVPIRHTDMDRDPWLFNCANGTLDLRTGRLREHRREDYITKLSPTEYHPDAPSPTWERFLGAVFPDADDEPDAECRACRRPVDHPPVVPPYTAMADAAASPTPILDALVLLDALGIELHSDGRGVWVGWRDWQRAARPGGDPPPVLAPAGPAAGRHRAEGPGVVRRADRCRY